MPCNQYPASASIYASHDLLMHQAPQLAYTQPPWQRQPSKPSTLLHPNLFPTESAFVVRSPFQRQSPPRRCNVLHRPQPISPPWSPISSPNRFSTPWDPVDVPTGTSFSPLESFFPPRPKKSEPTFLPSHGLPEDDDAPFIPVIPPPKTPDIIGRHPLPNLPPNHILQPTTSQLPSPIHSPLSSSTEFIERGSEIESPVFSPKTPSDTLICTPPRPIFDLSEPKDPMYNIHKKEMENLLLNQPVSSTPLCDITKEGQICHLRRYERAGVFVRNAVKFDKAFKHLSNLRENLQHLVIGLKGVPTVFTVDQVTDASVISLLQSLPNLQEVRFHGFTQLTKQSFDAALIYCPKLRVLAITGTRVPGPEPRKLVFSNGRPHRAGGMGSLQPDTLAALMPNAGPIRSVSFIGQHLQFIDISFQELDHTLAKQVTARRFGRLVVMRELQASTERYANGLLQVSDAVDGIRLQGLQRPVNPVASTVGWHTPVHQ